MKSSEVYSVTFLIIIELCISTAAIGRLASSSGNPAYYTTKSTFWRYPYPYAPERSTQSSGTTWLSEDTTLETETWKPPMLSGRSAYNSSLIGWYPYLYAPRRTYQSSGFTWLTETTTSETATWKPLSSPESSASTTKLNLWRNTTTSSPTSSAYPLFLIGTTRPSSSWRSTRSNTTTRSSKRTILPITSTTRKRTTTRQSTTTSKTTPTTEHTIQPMPPIPTQHLAPSSKLLQISVSNSNISIENSFILMINTDQLH